MADTPYLEIDEHGYPVDASLRELVTSGWRFEQILETVKPYFELYGWYRSAADTDDSGRPIQVIELVTGGWSGTEEVIDVLRGTTPWFLSWESSHRGGLHVLHLTPVAARFQVESSITLDEPDCEPETVDTPVVVGATYLQNSTKRAFVLAGLRAHGRVLLTHDGAGTCGPLVIDGLPVVEFIAQFRHDACNHNAHCCTVHGTHSNPHHGCILR